LRPCSGRALVLAFFCLLPFRFAQAQPGPVSTAEVQHLQQQVVLLTAQIDRTGYLVTGVLLFFMASACLGMWWNARTFRAFRSVGLYLLTVASVFFVIFLSTPNSWQLTLLILTSLLLPEMAADALSIRKGGWIWLNRISCIAALLLAWSPFLHLFYRITVDLSEVFVLLLAIVGFRRGSARTRLIAAALAFLWFFRAPLDPWVRRYVPIGFRIGGWHWNFGPVAMVLFGAVAIAVFTRELIEDQREKERLASEFEAGRAMQQILLGSQLPVIPGFHIESVYKAAGQVGGDFFHVLPTPDEGALVVVGDVSGKGLRAAMSVSTILGALRALPAVASAELLRALNRILIGRLDGGLVTCCIAHIAPSGGVIAANAGHLAPYRNGEELVLESGLPLGVATDAEYSESRFTLAPGDYLTFVSDGVVEARSSEGDLFGFERARQISIQSAEAIAQAAQAFGQEDDITVLTLTFAPAEMLYA
jgi:Stage II sporulation protein E (SpoIIE)